MSEEMKGTDAPGHAGVPGQPNDAELASMTREELVQLGGRMDGVETVYLGDRWPVRDTKAEKRAERGVAYWLLLGGFSGLALLLVFLFWPWEYKGGDTEGHIWYDLATPLYGLTFGLSILAIGIGAVLYQKRFIPEEISIQDRHDGASPEIQRKTVAANLTDALEGSTLRRRKLVGMSLGIGLGAFGFGTLVASPAASSRTRGNRSFPPPAARRRCCGRRDGPRASPARPSTWPVPPEFPVSRRSSRCGPRTSTPAAWRRCSRGGRPMATAPRSSHTSG